MSAAPADGPSPAKVAKRQDEEQQKKLHELVYFDIAGKGEPIRLAFTYAGIPFVDTRMQVGHSFMHQFGVDLHYIHDIQHTKTYTYMYIAYIIHTYIHDIHTYIHTEPILEPFIQTRCPIHGAASRLNLCVHWME